jgi:hypothetical protein
MTRPATTIARTISDPRLLGPAFDGPSWNLWRIVLRAAFGEPLADAERALFAEVAGGRSPPTCRVRELVIAVGRGGGKDSAATAIGTHIATTSDFSSLRPGERAYVLIIATDRDQAGVAFGYLRGYFEQVPALASLVERITDDQIDLKNGATIKVGTNNMRAPRGRTVCAAIFDEVAFWYSDEYANPDVEVDAAVTPGLMRFPGSMKILISSVFAAEGLLYDRISKYFGQDDPDHLAILGTSLQFNPTLDAAEIARQIELDPDKFNAEYNSVWRVGVRAFIDPAVVDAATDVGVAVRPYERNRHYWAAADPAGGTAGRDSFAFAIAHRDGDRIVLDFVREWRPPFNSDAVITEIAALCREYNNVKTVYGDRFGADITAQAFKRAGVTYDSPKLEQDGPKLNRSAIYLNALTLLNSARARLVESPRLRHQLVTLRRTAGRGDAKEKVDHPNGGHDDVANAACLALVLAAGGSGNVWADLVAKYGAPKPPPRPDSYEAMFGTGSAVEYQARRDAQPYGLARPGNVFNNRFRRR